MSILAAAKCTANAVAQKCKVLSHPSKCVLICGCKLQSKGHHVLSRVWTCLFLCRVRLKPEEVPNWLGNLCLSVSPPQAGLMPLLKKSYTYDPQLCVRVTGKVTCRINHQALDCCVYLL